MVWLFNCLLLFISEVCPKDSKFNPAYVLTRWDIAIYEEKVLIFVNVYKTNQYIKNYHVIPIPRNIDPALDLYTRGGQDVMFSKF